MRVIAKSTLTEYYTKNPQARIALEDMAKIKSEAAYRAALKRIPYFIATFGKTYVSQPPRVSGNSLKVSKFLSCET